MEPSDLHGVLLHYRTPEVDAGDFEEDHLSLVDEEELLESEPIFCELKEVKTAKEILPYTEENW